MYLNDVFQSIPPSYFFDMYTTLNDILGKIIFVLFIFQQVF